jgi:hypothetical protein
VTAMRLWSPGGVVLGAPGWRQAAHARWQPVAVGAAANARGAEWMLRAGDEQAFREFFTAIVSAQPSASVAWALDRFEMGCSQPTDAEALTDHLLGLRALLDATTTEAGQASFGLRLAALCAEEGARRELQDRMEAAIALERFVMGNSGGVRLDAESPRALVAEVEGHLRALLRDVLCGYLDADLKAVADEILIESNGEPLGEIEAHDLRDEPDPYEDEDFEPEQDFEPAPDFEPEPSPRFERHTEPITFEPELELDEEPDTAEMEPVAVTHQPAEHEPVQHELDGVTQSADWGWDEPEDYSAPV